jgi:hypothetical protein
MGNSSMTHEFNPQEQPFSSGRGGNGLAFVMHTDPMKLGALGTRKYIGFIAVSLGRLF